MTDEPPRIPREVPDWHSAGLCRQFPALNFSDPGAQDAFDKPSAETRKLHTAACRLVCSACPLRLACATDALRRGERWGVWGGLDYEDRKKAAALYGFPVPGDPPAHGTDARYKKWHCRCPECRAGHALYESMRRERVRLARDLWRTPVVLAASVGRARPGQLLLPLPIEPAALTLAA